MERATFLCNAFVMEKADSPPFHRLRKSLVALRLIFTETGGGEVLQPGLGSAI